MAQLLLILASQPNKVHSRDAIAESLWPGEYIEIARDCFRQVLALLNKHFRDAGGEPPLNVNRLTIQIQTSDCLIDLTELSELMLRIKAEDDFASLESAAVIATQPFAEGFTEEWIHSIRLGITTELLSLSIAKCEVAIIAKDFARAIVVADIGIRFGALDESLHLCKFNALRQLARDAESVALKIDFEQRLQKSLGLKPSRAWRDQTTFEQPIEERESAEPQVWISLGRPIDSFHGRQKELEYLDSMIGRDKPTRLLSITGPGGSGKTRLVSEYAMRVPANEFQRCLLIGLADLKSAEQFKSTLSQTLEVVIAPGIDLGKVLGPTFDAEPTLLVLDNCEHLLPDISELIRSMVSGSKNIWIIATSRVRLGIHGEQELALRPLEIPAESSSAQIVECPSVQLLMHRIRSFDHAYAPDDTEIAELSRLATLLDGIPLAIELAVSQMSYLSARELRESLEGSVVGLANEKLNLPARHLSLRETIRWSFDHLSVTAQELLVRLTVFPGSWTIDDVGPVTKVKTAGTLVEELCRLAVVRPQSGTTPRRFSLFPIVKEYCLERVDEQLSIELRKSHFHHYYQEILGFRDRFQGVSEAISHFKVDLSNIRLAFQSCADFEELSVHGFEFLMRTWILAEASGVLVEWARIVKVLSASGAISSNDQDLMLGFSAHATLNFGSKQEVDEHISSLFEVISRSTDGFTQQFLLNQLLPLICVGERTDCAERALELANVVSDPAPRANTNLVCMLGTGQVLALIKRYEEARDIFRALIELSTGANLERELVWATLHFSNSSIWVGKATEALPYFQVLFESNYVCQSVFVATSCIWALITVVAHGELCHSDAEVCAGLIGYERSRRQRLGPNLAEPIMALYNESLRTFSEELTSDFGPLAIEGESWTDAFAIAQARALVMRLL